MFDGFVLVPTMRKVNISFSVFFVSFCASIIDSRVPSTVIISSSLNIRVPPKDDNEKSVKTLKQELKQDNDDYIDTTQKNDLPYVPRFTGKTWKPIQFTSETHENLTIRQPIINDNNLIIDNDQKFRRKADASLLDSDVSGDEITDESQNAEKKLPAIQSKQNSTLITKPSSQQPLEDKGNFITPIIKPMKPSMKPHWLHSTKKAKNDTEVLRSKETKETSSVPIEKDDFERGEQVLRAKDTAELDKFASVFNDDMSYISASRERIIPDEGQLDMAVAKGSRIAFKRNKHQLCDRNILLPEGPKYNSKGKIYLTEFEANSNKTFPHTRRPSLVLPKCCNCCRKSVLGCQ